MKINDIFKTVVESAKEHSPEILIVTCAVGVVASTVMACKATLKVNDILEETKEAIDSIHEVQENPDIPEEKYSKEDAKKDLTIVYVQTGWKFVKLYGPAFLLLALSLTGMFTSNHILRQRNVALAAAYTAIDKAYTEYRKRVVEKFGEEADKELLYGTTTEKIEKEVVDEDTGKVKKVKETVQVSAIEGCSPYAFYFDKETSPYYEKNDDYCNMFIRSTQNFMNDTFSEKIKKKVLFRECLDAFGIYGKERERFSAIDDFDINVGWDKTNPDGDGFIAFKVTDSHRKLEDGSIIPTKIIDPNVDGCVNNKVKKLMKKTK